MFNKEIFKKLLLKSMGNLNTTEYSKQSGVNRTYISKLLNEKMDNPPSPEILRGLASVAKNNVTYTDFMQAAGYIEEKDLGNSDIRNPYDKNDTDEVDEFLLDLKKKAEERGLEFDENSVDDLLDLYEFLKKRQGK